MLFGPIVRIVFDLWYTMAYSRFQWDHRSFQRNNIHNRHHDGRYHDGRAKERTTSGAGDRSIQFVATTFQTCSLKYNIEDSCTIVSIDFDHQSLKHPGLTQPAAHLRHLNSHKDSDLRTNQPLAELTSRPLPRSLFHHPASGRLVN